MSTIVGMAPADAPVKKTGEPKAKKASGKGDVVVISAEEPKSDGDRSA